jgi:deoxyribonuclease (pyrimidine dimer)
MRCNTGVNPLYLTSQWIIAEQVELLMIGGMLRKNNYQPKSPIPPKFKLGTGHMLFWVNKMVYLKRRHEEVKREVARRGFKVTDKEIDLNEFPKEFVNDWQPTLEDSMILRERLKWKLYNKPNIWRYERKYITDIDTFSNELMNSELFYV